MSGILCESACTWYISSRAPDEATPVGTGVHFTPWTDALHACCTNGAELHWIETIN